MIIFFAVVLISLLSLNQILFPKLLIELTSVYQSSSENIFELGLWAIPFLMFNISFFLLWFFIKFFKIPIQKYIKYIFDFDLSKKTTILSLIVIFSIYLGFSIQGFDDLVSDSGDYAATLEGVKNVALYAEDGHLNYFILRYIFLAVSDEVFGNVNILPFLSSIALLSLAYLFTVKLSGKRISGIVALIILTQSYLFHLFDTTAAYDTFWVSFFLLALYLILKKPYISPVSFIASILTKMVAFLFFPIVVAFILSVNKSKKILAVYCIFPVFFIVLFFIPGAFSMEQFGTIDTRNMLIGFNSLAMGLRNDGIILLLFFPTLFLLINKSLSRFRFANFLLISITMTMLIPPLISGIADYTNQPYRLIPFITMFSISFGYLFSKKTNQISTK